MPSNPSNLTNVTGDSLRAARDALRLSRPEAAALPEQPVHYKTLVLWERARELPQSPSLPGYVAALEARGIHFGPGYVRVPVTPPQ